jgi:hypothetical protein
VITGIAFMARPKFPVRVFANIGPECEAWIGDRLKLVEPERGQTLIFLRDVEAGGKSARVA